MLTKDYFLNYKKRPSDSLFAHIGIMHERYNDLKHDDICLTQNERIYGLLIDMTNHWTPTIINLVHNKKIKTF